ncbi:MAG TPA: helix-turn-helix domain-containing protein [Candidatus Gemmiger stercorigallinarum]|nr:helix-turn-helix domain-containing protein [Candidatus Gemmiger stercorigallinarum]
MAEEPFRPDPAAQAEALRRMGARIAARRKALGLTQKQLAARLLVSDKTVSKWELGGSLR